MVSSLLWHLLGFLDLLHYLNNKKALYNYAKKHKQLHNQDYSEELVCNVKSQEIDDITVS